MATALVSGAACVGASASTFSSQAAFPGNGSGFGLPDDLTLRVAMGIGQQVAECAAGPLSLSEDQRRARSVMPRRVNCRISSPPATGIWRLSRLRHWLRARTLRDWFLAASLLLLAVVAVYTLRARGYLRRKSPKHITARSMPMS